MIQVTISDVGTPPILALVVEFNAPEIFTRNFTAGPYVPGKTYSLGVTGLQDNTQYSFTVSAVNYQGRGKATTRYNSTTGECKCTFDVPFFMLTVLLCLLTKSLVVGGGGHKLFWGTIPSSSPPPRVKHCGGRGDLYCVDGKCERGIRLFPRKVQKPKYSHNKIFMALRTYYCCRQMINMCSTKDCFAEFDHEPTYSL